MPMLCTGCAATSGRRAPRLWSPTTTTPRRTGNCSKTGKLSFLRDPDIDAWYTQQVTERDQPKRQALLHKVQQKAHDEARFMPIRENAFLCASGPRLAVSGLHGDSFAYSAPYEEVRLKSS
jgi:ABC-type transport system substrate-binding protein